MRRLTRLALIFTLALSPTAGNADFIKIYFTENITAAGNILTAIKDGTGLATIPVAPTEPSQIAIDPEGGKIYWSEPTNNRIRRSNLDGTNIETIIVSTNAYGIALEPTSNTLYFSHGASTRFINKAQLDGTNSTSLLTTGEFSEDVDLDIDVNAGKLFWSEPTNDFIRQANLDGSGAGTIINVGSTGFIDGITVDQLNQRIYWLDAGNQNISSATLTGASLVVVTSVSPDGGKNGIAIDGLDGPTVYWTEAAGIRINRHNIATTTTEVILTSIDGLIKPTDIALLFEDTSPTPTPTPTPAAEVVPTPPSLSVDPQANEVIATFESFTIDFFFPDGFGNSIQGIGSPKVRYSSTARRSDGVTRRVVSKNNQARFKLPSRSLGASAVETWTIDYRAIAVIKRKPAKGVAAFAKLSHRIKDLKAELVKTNINSERIDIQNQIQTARAKKALAKSRTLIKTQTSEPSEPFIID